ncbi:MAG: potassium channel family protein [Bdellovibrionota bacterium]
MEKEILIIGLGHFGMGLAKSLSEKGAAVLAMDKKRFLVEEASEFATEAVVIDATDEAELLKFEPQKRDCVICAIGDESKESSIICTALLRQIGAPYIISRANDKTHERILKLVGAHQVINPEKEFGRRFAHRVLYRDIINDVNFDNDLHLTEIHVQESMIGKNLVELALPKKFGIVVAAIRKGNSPKIFQPVATDKLCKGDKLIIVSSEEAIAKFINTF